MPKKQINRFFVGSVLMQPKGKTLVNQKTHEAIVSLLEDKDGPPVALLHVKFVEMDRDKGRLAEGEFGRILNQLVGPHRIT